MADGGEFLLTGVIAGGLFKAVSEARTGELGIKIKAVRPLHRAEGLARTVLEVEMESGTYYVTVTETDAHLDDDHTIEESP